MCNRMCTSGGRDGHRDRGLKPKWIGGGSGANCASGFLLLDAGSRGAGRYAAVSRTESQSRGRNRRGDLGAAGSFGATSRAVGGGCRRRPAGGGGELVQHPRDGLRASESAQPSPA